MINRPTINTALSALDMAVLYPHLRPKTRFLLKSLHMIVGACCVQLYLPGNNSLKGKRGRLKPILVRLPREFNLAAAETDLQDVWQSAEIGLVTVANDATLVRGLLEKSVQWIELHAPDVQIVNYRIELR